MPRPVIALLLLAALLHAPGAGVRAEDQEGCTIGVAAGFVTADGRPLVWKTRDADAVDNEVRFVTDAPLPFVGVFTVGGVSPWMSVNVRGFALVNATSVDLPGRGTWGNGSFMRYAIGHCATVSEFEHLLDSTNATGRGTQAHFAVIDALGAAAIFETGDSVYWKFDATDRESTPGGYVLRANFAMNGRGVWGANRYRRSAAIIEGLRAENRLGYPELIQGHLRDFAAADGTPYPVPYSDRPAPHLPVGLIPTAWSIARDASVSAAVIQGVLPGEQPITTTMWTLLGQPACAVAVPVWAAGLPPRELRGEPTAALCDAARKHKAVVFRFERDPLTGRMAEHADSYLLRDGGGHGIWGGTFTAERLMFSEVERLMTRWRWALPDTSELLALEERMAVMGLAALRGVPGPPGDPDRVEPSRPALAQNYPNPFNAGTTIVFDIPVGTRGRVSLRLYDVLGREVVTLVDEEKDPGSYAVRWDAGGRAGGTYFCRLQMETFVETRRLILMK